MLKDNIKSSFVGAMSQGRTFSKLIWQSLIQFSNQAIGAAMELMEKSKRAKAAAINQVRNAANWLNVPWSLQSVLRRKEVEWSLFNRYRKQLALLDVA